MRGSRRRILGALGGSMAAWALSPALRAQQPRGPYRIGFIHSADDRLVIEQRNLQGAVRKSRETSADLLGLDGITDGAGEQHR